MRLLRPFYLAPKKKLFIPQNEERARYDSMLGRPGSVRTDIKKLLVPWSILFPRISKSRILCSQNPHLRDFRAAPATFIPDHGTQGNSIRADVSYFLCNSLTPIPAFCFQAIVNAMFSFRLLLLVISSNALKRLLESSSHSFLCSLCSVTFYL